MKESKKTTQILTFASFSDRPNAKLNLYLWGEIKVNVNSYDLSLFFHMSVLLYYLDINLFVMIKHLLKT